MVTRILFVCHGNICRSPMAEFVMKDIVSKNGLTDSFYIESCATSTEEIGCDIYPPVRRELEKRGIPYDHRNARQMTSDDYDRFDLIIAMDHQNLRNLQRFVGNDEKNKVSLLLSYIGKGDLADPWYTGDFDRTFDDVQKACLALLKILA